MKKLIEKLFYKLGYAPIKPLESKVVMSRLDVYNETMATSSRNIEELAAELFLTKKAVAKAGFKIEIYRQSNPEEISVVLSKI